MDALNNNNGASAKKITLPGRCCWSLSRPSVRQRFRRFDDDEAGGTICAATARHPLGVDGGCRAKEWRDGDGMDGY